MSLHAYHLQKEQVAQAARHALSALAALPTELRADTTPVDTALERLESGRFQVAFLGQMNAGKSSLVNALIFGRQVLPVSPTPHTARLSVVRHGDRERAIVTFVSREEWSALRKLADEQRSALKRLAATATGGDEPAEPSLGDRLDAAERRLGPELGRLLGTQREIQLGELREYCATTDEVEGKYVAITREIAIEAPHRWAHDVEFVDTPGLFDPVRSRSKVTLDYLKRADAVVFIIYSGAPMSRPDAEFLATSLLPVGVGKVLVTLNKIDTVPATQRADVQRYVRSSLQTVLDQAAQHIGGDGAWRQALDSASEVHATSSLLALLGRSHGLDPRPDTAYHWRRVAERDLNLPPFDTARAEADRGPPISFDAAVEASGVPAFEAALERFLVEEKGRMLLAGPVNRATAALAESTRKLETARLRTTAKIEDLARSARELDDEIARRRGERQRLETGLSQVEAQLGLWVNEALRGRVDRMRSEVDSAVERTRQRATREIQSAGWWELATSQATINRANLLTSDGVKSLSGALRSEVRSAFASLHQTIQDRLRGVVQTHVGNIVPSLSLDLAVDEIERAAFEFEEQVPETAIDNLGFWNPLFGPDAARAELTRRINTALEAFRAAWIGEIRTLPGRFHDAIDEPFQKIRAELGAALDTRIQDIERAIAERARQRPELEAEKARLEAERHALAAHATRVASARQHLERAGAEAGVGATSH